MATTNKTMTITIKMVDQLTRVTASVIGSIKKLTSFATSATLAIAKIPIGLMRAATSINAYIGAQIAGAPLRSLMETVDRLDEIAEKSRQFGISVEAYSVYEYAAKRANVAAEDLAAGIKMGEKNLGDFALTGKGPAADALARLSIKATDFAGRVRSIEELLPEIGKAVAGLGQAEKQSVLADIFGKGFEPIERLLASGDLTKLRKELEDLGGVVTQRQVQAAGRIDDALDRVKASWMGVKAEAVAALADTIEPLLNRSAALIAKIAPTVRSISFSAGLAAGNGPGSDQAGAALQRYRDAAANFLLEGAKQAGVAFGLSAAEILRAAIPTFGAPLGDMLQDGLAKAGVIDSYSLSGQARNLRTVLEQRRKQAGLNFLPGFQSQLDATNKAISDRSFQFGSAVSGDPEMDRLMKRRKTLQEEVDRIQGKASELNISKWEANLSEIQTKVMAQTRERDAEFKQTLADIGPRLKQIWGEAKDNIAGARSEMDAASAQLQGVYAQFAPDPTLAAKGAEGGRKFASATATGLGTIVPMLAAIAMQVKEKMSAIAKSEVLPDLRARTLDAQGFTGQAAALRLQMTQEKERLDLTQKYGEVIGGELLPRLREVQVLEERRATFDSKQAEILARLADAERAYKDGVSLRAAQVQAATLTQARANELNEDARDRITGATRTTLENLKQLQAAFPEFANIATGAVYDVENSIEQLRLQVDGLAAGNWKQGLLDGLEEVQRKARDLYGFARGFVGSLTDQISGGLAPAIVDVASRARSAKEAFKDFLSSTLRMVSQLIIQFLILRAISSIAGAFSASAPVATTGPGAGTQIPDLAGPSIGTLAARGGVLGRIGFRGNMPRMAMAASIVGLMGGGVAGYVANGANRNADTVLAALAHGESVNTRAATRRNLRAIEHMNAGGTVGGGGGGINVTNHITINGGSGSDTAALAKEVEAAATRGVLKAVRRDPSFRSEWKSAMG